MIVRLRLNLLQRLGAGARPPDASVLNEPDEAAIEPAVPSLRQIDASEVLHALSEAGNAREQHDPNLVTPREMIHGLTHMLMPLCAIAYALALWRIGEDMGWARSFAIRRGLLSHWQVWFGIGVGLQMLIYTLRRRFRNDDDQNQATS